MINQVNFTGAARLAVVAANATTNNSAVSFDSSDQGFQDDTTIRTQSDALLNDVVTQGLKVESFAGFQSDLAKVTTTVDNTAPSN
jgi:hypothetical protein